MANLSDISIFLLPYLHGNDWTELLCTQKNILIDKSVFFKLKATIKHNFFYGNPIINPMIRELTFINPSFIHFHDSLSNFINVKTLYIILKKPYPLLLKAENTPFVIHAEKVIIHDLDFDTENESPNKTFFLTKFIYYFSNNLINNKNLDVTVVAKNSFFHNTFTIRKK